MLPLFFCLCVGYYVFDFFVQTCSCVVFFGFVVRFCFFCGDGFLSFCGIVFGQFLFFCLWFLSMFLWFFGCWFLRCV